MAISVTLVLEQLGGYRPIAKQSRTRIVLTSIVAPLIGVSVIVLLVFATKGSSWSRLFVFSYAALAMAGLGAYRMSARWYCRSRIAAGFHAKGVVLVGEPPSIEWMARGERPVITGNGSATKAFVYIEDRVGGLIRFAERVQADPDGHCKDLKTKEL